jgi:uncharacterized protein (DUF1800 family)
MGWAGLAIACLAAHAGATEPTTRVVEYFNAFTGHYFMSGAADELATVDSGGAGPGWKRTGGEFGVYKSANDAPGLSPVCRFYTAGANSHFFTADASECGLLRDNNYGWQYEGIAFYVATPSAGQCAAGTTPVYRSYNNRAAQNDSNHRFTVDATVFAKSASFGYPAQEGVVMCAALSAADVRADAVRLLRQASFGPTDAEIDRVASMGAAAWIDQQLSLPATKYTAYPWVAANRPDTCVDNRTLPITPTSFCARDNYTLFPLQLEFFRNALAQPDQLRGRTAFALSQVFVTSGVANSRNYAMREYQQMLVDNAFANYHDVLLGVTLSPNMGDYLDMANNNKASNAANTQPNENYAREVLQLFSIGTVLLNADGSPVRDASGKAVDAYDQDVIEGFAHVFTGWTYAPAAGVASRNNNPRNYTGQMIPVAATHDFAAKELLNGAMAPANLAMAQDLEAAHQSIVNHANVGPFIGRQLIQKLVTGDPTPGYVARITAVWNNNGAGQRGDLRAVVRAILLDPEARGARKIDPAYGKLQEPVLFLAGIARAANARSDGVYLRAQSGTLAQNVFYAPTVFNYYSPSYGIPGTPLVGPEFQLLTSATSIARANVVNALVLSANGIAADANVYGATGTQLDLAPYTAVAGDTNALLDRIDRNVMGGTMTASMRSAIASAMNAVAASDALGRARAALYLTFASPQYQVQR